MLRLTVSPEEYLMINDKDCIPGRLEEQSADYGGCAEGSEHRQERGSGEPNSGFGGESEAASVLCNH